MSTPTILYIEDEADVSDLVRHLLTHAGYRVETAATGHEALAKIARGSPVLIVLDLMLPDIDGFALCEILRRDEGTATDRKSTRLNSSHSQQSRMPSSA